MNQVIRWCVAGLVTVAAFSAATWICGALVLPTLMKDPGVRWGIAGSLGVAVAALVALWGHSFAAAQRPNYHDLDDLNWFGSQGPYFDPIPPPQGPGPETRD